MEGVLAQPSVAEAVSYTIERTARMRDMSPGELGQCEEGTEASAPEDRVRIRPCGAPQRENPRAAWVRRCPRRQGHIFRSSSVELARKTPAAKEAARQSGCASRSSIRRLRHPNRCDAWIKEYGSNVSVHKPFRPEACLTRRMPRAGSICKGISFGPTLRTDQTRRARVAWRSQEHNHSAEGYRFRHLRPELGE